MPKFTRRKLMAGVAAAATVELLRTRQSKAFAGAGNVAGEAGDTSPAAEDLPIQTPLSPDGVAGSLNRLSKGSRGKTPTDKEFTAEWVRSLAVRGKPTVYTPGNSKNFAYIGMPVGGIGAGQLYLGGDGKLWWWDIFNLRRQGGSEGNYLQPPTQNNAGDNSQIVLAQGFAVRYKSGDTQIDRKLDKTGFKTIEFTGEYPVGQVVYRDAAIPLNVVLEAFSPYLPGKLEHSAFPATILQYTLTNTGSTTAQCAIAGWMENPLLIASGGDIASMQRRNRLVHRNGATMLLSDAVAEAAAAAPTGKLREPINFETFSDGTFKRWQIVGDAFGSAPASFNTNISARPDWDQRNLKPTMLGKYMADSFNTHLGKGPDAATGKLVSRSFPINRRYINVHLGGGNHPGQTCVNLIVDGKVAESATGDNSDSLKWHCWNVAGLAGKSAHIEIVDSATGGWGHILVDAIVFADKPEATAGDLLQSPEKQPDYGTMALALINARGGDIGGASVDHAALPASALEAGPKAAQLPMDTPLIGSVGQSIMLKPGESKTVSFVVAWHFPNPIPLRLVTSNTRWYARQFKDAGAVVAAIAKSFDRLTSQTKLFRKTWYDSTLPHWLLERTLANACILSSATAYLMSDGRFYGNEGCYCCPGTCTHVWEYNQVTCRLFPEIERRLREKVEFNPAIGFEPDGGVAMRGEFDHTVPADGQCGIILRTFQAHKMFADREFLRGNYDNIKKAIEYLIKTNDPGERGVLTGPQHNTLDAAWFGEISWITSLYIASLCAGAAMADEMLDAATAQRYRKIAARGRSYVDAQLFNGEYYFQKADPQHANNVGSYDGCEIDQLLGQSWAYLAGLGQILDPVKVAKAIDSLWRYSFTTNIGKYRKAFPPGRWFAAGADAGLIMCTWPQGGYNIKSNWSASYFNECMTGFEHAAASLMIAHGRVDKGLAVIRAIQDRYAGDKRNPFNEIECGGFYSRAMASFGVYDAITGWRYHGPRGEMEFNPKLSPENFKAAFVAAGAWGTYRQRITASGMTANAHVASGTLRLTSITLHPQSLGSTPAVRVHSGGRSVPAIIKATNDGLKVSFSKDLFLPAGYSVNISVSK